MRAAQERVAREDEHASFVRTDDVPRSKYLNDLIYFGTDGVILIGDRAGRIPHMAMDQTVYR